jgi:hypothetical protein
MLLAPELSTVLPSFSLPPYRVKKFGQACLEAKKNGFFLWLPSLSLR